MAPLIRRALATLAAALAVATLAVVALAFAADAGAQTLVPMEPFLPFVPPPQRAPVLTLGAGASVTATDNIDLAPDDQAESALIVTETGLVRLRRTGSRLDTALDGVLSLDTIIGETDTELDPRPAGGGFARAELLEDRFFLHTQGAWRQALVDTTAGLSANPASGRAFLTDVQVLSVTPYWHQRFGDVADAELRYRHQNVSVGSAEIGDSSSDLAGVRVASGRGLTRLRLVGLAETERVRGAIQSGDLDRTTGLVAGEYPVTRWLSLLASAGYEVIDSPALDDPPQGPIGAVGLRWRPAARSDVALTVGRRFGGLTVEALGSVRISPRFTLHTIAGQTIEPLGYALGQDVFASDPLTGQIIDPRTDLPIDLEDPGLGLRGEVARVRRVEMRLTGQYPRDTVNLRVNREWRDFDVRSDEDFLLLRLDWDHRLTRIADLMGAVSYRIADQGGSLGRADTLLARLEYAQYLTRSAVASLAYARSQRFADLGFREYSENAVSLGLRVLF